ncbi:hypothetical protein C1H46_008155 [Malus baccata]|uniref:Uncharacterized protein n=1 Tax=Malus baccata TaxID=106549 RepID=A0A540N588_MALBA|nr:hypothetical protein C1H46_008155 [Malus baccata]
MYPFQRPKILQGQKKSEKISTSVLPAKPQNQKIRKRTQISGMVLVPHALIDSETFDSVSA